MKHVKPDPRLPRHDYGLALQSAVTWLGDRYLLAEPVMRRADSRTWMDARRTNEVIVRKH